MLRNALLHCADIGNPMKSVDQALKWVTKSRVMHSSLVILTGGRKKHQKKGPHKIQEKEHVQVLYNIQICFLKNFGHDRHPIQPGYII